MKQMNSSYIRLSVEDSYINNIWKTTPDKLEKLNDLIVGVGDCLSLLNFFLFLRKRNLYM